MSAYRTSSPSERKAALEARLEEEGYLFFPRVDAPLPVLAEFGRLRLQDGRPYYVVRAGEKLQPQDGGGLMPHTDDFNDGGAPPRLVALHCIRPDAAGFGHTLLADGRIWLANLSPQERSLLRLPRRYRKGEGFVLKPFLSGEILRVSFGHLEYRDDPAMAEIMAKLEQWFAERSIPIAHRGGSLLLWNNWRMIHGRNPYRDLRRELHRYHFD